VSNAEIVRAYWKSWDTLDPEIICSYFSDDIVYEDVPVNCITRGRNGILDRTRRWCASIEKADMEIHSLFEGPDGTICCERSDHFWINGQELVFRVLAIGTLRDGKIAQWREYWDALAANERLSEILGRPFSMAEFT
jgi:ketosteroid isomerase-like protein